MKLEDLRNEKQTTLAIAVQYMWKARTSERMKAYDKLLEDRLTVRQDYDWCFCKEDTVPHFHLTDTIIDFILGK